MIAIERKKLEQVLDDLICASSYCNTYDAIDVVKEALAQPEQEPVQKRPQNCGSGYCSCIECVMELEQEPTWWLVEYNEWAREFVAKKPEVSIAVKKVTPLYTTPPKREWVGLTDEEIYDSYNEPRSDSEMVAFAREVEAKLKAVNGFHSTEKNT